MFSLMSFLQNESEILPFPNREEEFVLPEDTYADLMDKNFPRQGLSKPDSEKSEKHEKIDKTEHSGKAEKEEKPEPGVCLILLH